MHAALLTATALSALANWWSRVGHSERIETWSKPLTTSLVIVVALVSGASTAHIVTAVIALALCLGGDVALMSLVDNFVLGLASFLLGHLVFIALFIQYGMPHVALAGVAFALMVGLAATAGRRIVRGAISHDAKLRIPVSAYLLVISAMTVCGWATGRGWVIAGTTLFVISDSLLGWRQFVRERAWMAVAVMITYHGAIVSLALSLW
jgi:uncharacterized membrane protein YhhN